MRKIQNLAMAIVLPLLAPLMAGQSACNEEPVYDIEIGGEWSDSYGGAHTIDDYEWVQGGFGPASVFLLETYDNDMDFAIALNGPDNAWNPGLWSRFDWTDMDDMGGWYYCQTAFAAETYDEAYDTPASNSGNLDNGCGGFAWTYMVP